MVIRQNPVFGLHLMDFTAAKSTYGTQIKWKTENEQNYTNFTVERSIDNGKTFDVLGGFPSSSEGTYSFLDKNPLIALNLYRLKLEDLNGTISYSNVISLQYSALNNNLVTHGDMGGISIYPNPVQNTVLNLSIDKIINSTGGLAVASANNSLSRVDALPESTTVYSIKIINSTGSIVKTIETVKSYLQTDISGLSPGEYIIQVMNKANKHIVGKSTFIKL